MNHLASSLTGKNSFWRYAVMLVAMLLASNTIGSVPIIVAIIAKAVSDPGIISTYSANPTDLTLLGLSPYMSLVFMLIPFLAGLAAFMLLMKPLHGRTFLSSFNGTSKIRWSHFFISALVWMVLSALYLFVYMKAEPSNFTVNNTSIGSLLLVSVIAIMLIPFQAGYEEVIFRGYLMQGFAVVLRNKWFPLIMTSVLFGLMHTPNPEVKQFGFLTMMPQYILFGLIFGVVTILDDGIEAALGAHTANNAFLVVMVTNQSSALQSPAVLEQHAVYPWTEFTGLLVSGFIFILILMIVFRWKLNAGWNRLD